MTIFPHLRRSFLLAAAATTPACSTSGVSGSLTLSRAEPCLMRVRSADATDMHVQIWNRGPADVDFEQLHPDGDGDGNGDRDGTLVAHGPGRDWHRETIRFELLLTPVADRATVVYRMSSGGSVEMYVGPEQ